MLFNVDSRPVNSGVRRLQVTGGEKRVSFWLIKKEQGDRKFLYLLFIPWEVVLPLIGFILFLIIMLLRPLGIDVF
jgi:hypothetical protein